MPHYIFFSWQSDTANRAGRGFIQDCLERALGLLEADVEIDPADREIAVDRDTLNVPGSPPIMETIFAKIDQAAVFLADLTYVAERFGGGRMPNPNVCIEHGYALKTLTWRRLVAVMNTAMGCAPGDLGRARATQLAAPESAVLQKGERVLQLGEPVSHRWGR